MGEAELERADAKENRGFERHNHSPYGFQDVRANEKE
jgi:hypothetical protein